MYQEIVEQNTNTACKLWGPVKLRQKIFVVEDIAIEILLKHV